MRLFINKTQKTAYEEQCEQEEKGWTVTLFLGKIWKAKSGRKI